LLPVYDEYIVAYRDRDVVPQGPARVPSRSSGYVQFQHALVIDGQVAGTWRAAPKGKGIELRVAPLRPLSAGELRAVRRQAALYQRFVGTAVSLSGLEP
jgi:hypothetical protein